MVRLFWSTWMSGPSVDSQNTSILATIALRLPSKWSPNLTTTIRMFLLQTTQPHQIQIQNPQIQNLPLSISHRLRLIRRKFLRLILGPGVLISSRRRVRRRARRRRVSNHLASVRMWRLTLKKTEQWRRSSRSHFLSIQRPVRMHPHQQATLRPSPLTLVCIILPNNISSPDSRSSPDKSSQMRSTSFNAIMSVSRISAT